MKCEILQCSLMMLLFVPNPRAGTLSDMKQLRDITLSDHSLLMVSLLVKNLQHEDLSKWIKSLHFPLLAKSSSYSSAHFIKCSQWTQPLNHQRPLIFWSPVPSPVLFSSAHFLKLMGAESFPLSTHRKSASLDLLTAHCGDSTDVQSPGYGVVFP